MQFGFHVRDVFIIHNVNRFCSETPRNVTRYVMDTPYILGLTSTYWTYPSLRMSSIGTYLWCKASEIFVWGIHEFVQMAITHRHRCHVEFCFSDGYFDYSNKKKSYCLRKRVIVEAILKCHLFLDIHSYNLRSYQ